jgi:NAD(P)-dependent dehydrogenase (short-subunit alcohol dehydrogenase family)
MQIEKNTFIVTGAASGLGKATAQMLIKEGANVILLDSNESLGKETSKELGANSLFIKADVCSEIDVQAAIQLAIEKFGTISGLINCAGVGSAKRVVAKDSIHDLDFFQKVININLTGTFNTIRLAVANMQDNPVNAEEERGIIINTASVAAFDGQIGQAAYAASKGGIVAMTLPLAREFARMGIRVMTVAPGIFETPLLAALPQEAQDSLGKQVPFPARLGNPAEFALLIKNIIGNPMLNGEVIRLDGAIRMGAK